MSWEDHGMVKYEDYFQSDWWFDLNWKYVKGNRDARCWICERGEKLLIHHISYENLFKEKLYRDIYILCFDCHNKTHLWFFKSVKIPLKTNWLLLSMRLNRMLFCIRNGRISLSLLWFLLIVLISLAQITKYLLKVTIILLSKLIWRLLLKPIFPIDIQKN